VTYREKLEAATGRRLFVAIPIAPRVREAITSLVDSVRKGNDPAVRDVRWVRLDGLHLTIRFIGPTDEGRVADLATAVDQTAMSLDPFDVVIAGGGAFPSVARPRALWLGVDDGAAELEAASRRLDDEMADRGWPRDERQYRPHLTLARSDGVRAGPAVAKRLIAAAAGVREPFRAKSLVLFESISGGGPARYEPLHEAAIGSPLQGSSSGSPNV
jgi:RNA 2',3'-cyclic 3'-phosphodiesterase